MGRTLYFTALCFAIAATSAAYAAPAATATAPSVQSQIDDAVKAVETLQTQAQANNDTQQRNDAQQTQSYLIQVKDALARKDWSKARSAAVNASRMLQTPEFQVVWSQLLVLLNKQQEALQAKLPATITEELDKARNACLQAKTEDQLDGLEQELQEMAQQANRMPRSSFGRTDYTRLQNAAQAVHYWRDMLAAKSTGNINSALSRFSNLQNISQYRLFSPTVLEKYRQQMIDGITAERDQKIAAFAAAIAKAPTLDACQKVVDAFNKETRLNSSRNFYDSGVDDANRMLRAGETAQVWIDVNRAKDAGQPRHALTLVDRDWHVSMRPGMVNFSGNMSLDYSVIPQKKWTDLTTELKSMIADESTVIREPALKEEVDALNKADTLDAFIEAAHKNPVDPGRTPGMYSQTTAFDNQTVVGELTALIPNVQALSAMRDDLANSRFRNIISAWGGSAVVHPAERSEAAAPFRGLAPSTTDTHYRWKQRVQGFERQMLVQALKGFSQIPDLKLEGDESPDQMLLRVADAASKAEDYHKTLLALDAYRVTFYGADNAPQWLASDIRGCSEYLAGVNYQSAEVPLDAAKSFLAVLGETGSLVPTKKAGEQIKTLRQKFPEIVSTAAAQVSPVSAPATAPPAAAPPPPAAPAPPAVPLLPPAAAIHPPATRP